MAGENTYLESDGKSVNVTAPIDIDPGQVVYISGWLGIAEAGGDSGAMMPINVDEREYQLTVPSGLTVNFGDIIYITVANVTDGIPADNAYTTSAGAGKVAAFKATMNKDSNNVVTAKMLGQFAS